MKILMCSVPFRPSVGGIETISALLAQQFWLQGHAVTVVTQTASLTTDTEPYTVLRRPSAWQLLQAVRNSDVVLHNQISLRLAWPLGLVHRPWVVGHHTWLPASGPGAWAGRLKRACLRWAVNVAVSDAVAADLKLPTQVIPNPYDDDLFQCLPGTQRSRELVFVGRLVSDKGVAVLLQALALLQSRGLSPQLSIIGSGPEEAALRQQVQALGLQEQVHFAGKLVGQPLVKALNTHRVAVVPSVWEEPFGLVALEAQACGCLPVVANSGGLPQAAGPAGVVFAKGDAAALADCLTSVLRRLPTHTAAQDPAAQQHLQQHQPASVARAYLAMLEQAQRKGQA
jgi:glycogen(starch) synthase